MTDWTYDEDLGEMQRVRPLFRARAKISPMISGGFRAHVWTRKGYSTKTFYDPADAQSWADLTMEKHK